MRKVLSLLCGSLIVFILLITPENSVKAAPCDCEEHGIVHIYGAEKNKIIANLISSAEFKDKKMELMSNGYSWNGVSKIEVVKNNIVPDGPIGISVPFTNPDGNIEVAVFVDGEFVILATPPSMD